MDSTLLLETLQDELKLFNETARKQMGGVAGLKGKAEDEKRLLAELNEFYDRAIKKDDSYFIELVQKREHDSIKRLPENLFKRDGNV